MADFNSMSPQALRAAMIGGTIAWGQFSSAADHVRYAEPVDPRSRSRCSCGCKTRETHRGMANGIVLMGGCEFKVRRWVKDPASIYKRQPLPET